MYTQKSGKRFVSPIWVKNTSLLLLGIALGTILSILWINTPKMQTVSYYDAVKAYPVKSMAVEGSEWTCEKDTDCKAMATVVYFESRGERTREALRAVAWVVLNRKNSPYFPDNVVAVISQGCAFEFYCKGIYKQGINDYTSWKVALEVAENVYKGKVSDPTYGSDHFVNLKKLKKIPKWVGEYEQTVSIGNHTFYKRG